MPGKKIKIVGIGKSGIKTVNKLFEQGLSRVEYIGIDTDTYSINSSKADNNILMKSRTTGNLTDSSEIEKVQKSFMKYEPEFYKAFTNTEIIFVVTGLGGCTGTLAAPVIAGTAVKTGAVTIGVVTKPYNFEGEDVNKLASKGVKDLKEKLDYLLVIPNEYLLRISGLRRITAGWLFEAADSVLCQGIEVIMEFISEDSAFPDLSNIKTSVNKNGLAIWKSGGKVSRVRNLKLQ